jgi:FtsZ-binding cell division protein ZapB
MMEIAQLKESNRMIQMRHELSQRQYESLNQSNFKQSLKLSYATRSILMAGVSMQYG